MIYFSKVDLIQNKEIYDQIVDKYSEIGYTIFSNETKLDELKSYLKSGITVVMGQTGAGKSTLLNKLLGYEKLEVGEISKALGRGRHTTRHIELVDVDGALIADTPGFSALDFQKLDTKDLDNCFKEFRNYNSDCKFRSCTHTHEPKCAVKQAVQDKAIWQSRYDDYLLFLNELIYRDNHKY